MNIKLAQTSGVDDFLDGLEGVISKEEEELRKVNMNSATRLLIKYNKAIDRQKARLTAMEAIRKELLQAKLYAVHKSDYEPLRHILRGGDSYLKTED